MPGEKVNKRKVPAGAGAINRQVVKGLQLLPPEDQTFCKALHGKYTAVYRSLLAMAIHCSAVCNRLADRDKPDYSQPFYFFNNFMRDTASSKYRMIKGLNKDFNERLTGYFKEKYRYNFSPLEIKEGVSYIGTEKVHAIAANIIAQSGPGLVELGKHLLHHEIRSAIREDKCILKQRAATIIFSSFMKCVKRHGDNSYLLYDRQRLTALLRLLSIFHGGLFVLAENEIALIDSLYSLNRVRFDESYRAFDRYTLRFYRNGRFDLSFPDKVSAAGFLELITAKED